MITTLCYIDPASTALIWQVLAGIFISLGVVFGVFWRKITTFFKSLWVKLFRKNKNQDVEKVVDESMLEVEDEVNAEEVKDAEVNENTESTNHDLEDNKNKENLDDQNNKTENK